MLNKLEKGLQFKVRLPLALYPNERMGIEQCQVRSMEIATFDRAWENI